MFGSCKGFSGDLSSTPATLSFPGLLLDCSQVLVHAHPLRENVSEKYLVRDVIGQDGPTNDLGLLLRCELDHHMASPHGLFKVDAPALVVKPLAVIALGERLATDKERLRRLFWLVSSDHRDLFLWPIHIKH